MARALAAAIVVSLLAVSGAGGTGAQTPKRGGTIVIAETPVGEPACLNVLVDACAAPGLVGEVLSGAFEIAPGATFRPDLVSRSEIVSKQPFTLVYRIRPEARWSDGGPRHGEGLRLHRPRDPPAAARTRRGSLDEGA